MSTRSSEQSRLPLRAMAMVLLAVAVVCAGIGAKIATSSHSDPLADAGAKPTATATASAVVPPSAAPTSSAAPAAKPTVRVYNNSTVAGLASKAATTLTSAGWTITETGNYSDSELPATTVFYGTAAGEKEAATSIATLLGAKAAPRISTLTARAPGIIVIVTSN